MPEVRRRLEAQYGDSPPVFKENLAATVTAQFNATLAGAKPAFLETVPGLTAALARDLPPGVRFIEAGGLECIYHEAAVAKELNLPNGADVDAVVRQKLEAGTYGRLLGYGADTMLDRPCHRVSIRRNGEDFFGFMSSPSKAKAEKYAKARMQDFTEQFPGEQWQIFIEYLPGDEVKAAHCNQKHLPGCPNAHPNANRNAREGETKKQKQRNQAPKNTGEPAIPKHETFYVSKPIETKKEFEERALRLTKNYGKPGRGSQAPGMKAEFFVSGKVVRELKSQKHLKRSVDRCSHLTAADNVLELWEKSYPLKKYRDKEKPYEESSIEWMHKRVAYLNLKGIKYEVEITAKEFKRDVNTLYQVKTKAIK